MSTKSNISISLFRVVGLVMVTEVLGVGDIVLNLVNSTDITMIVTVIYRPSVCGSDSFLWTTHSVDKLLRAIEFIFILLHTFS